MSGGELPLVETPRPGLAVGVVAGVAVALLVISLAVRWYAREISIPRYCADPDQALARLHRIVTEPTPATNGEKRTPYVVAAKLLFLVPRASDEPVSAYLARVETHLRERCA